MATYNTNNSMMTIPDGAPTGAGGTKIIDNFKTIADCFRTSGWTSGSSYEPPTSIAYKCARAYLSDYAVNASHAVFAEGASTAGYAYSAEYAYNAGYVYSAEYAYSASYVYSAEYAYSASYVYSAEYASSAGYVYSAEYATKADFMPASAIINPHIDPSSTTNGFQVSPYTSYVSGSTSTPVAVYGNTGGNYIVQGTTSGSGSGSGRFVSGAIYPYATMSAFGPVIMEVQCCFFVPNHGAHFAKLTFYISDRIIRLATVDNSYFMTTTGTITPSNDSITYTNVNPYTQYLTAGYYAYINAGSLYVYYLDFSAPAPYNDMSNFSTLATHPANISSPIAS